MLLQIKLNWSKGQDSQSSHQGFTLGWLFHLQTRTLGALRVAALWVGFDFGTQPVWPRHVSIIRWKLLFRSSKLLNTEWVSTRFSANAFKSIYIYLEVDLIWTTCSWVRWPKAARPLCNKWGQADWQTESWILGLGWKRQNKKKELYKSEVQIFSFCALSQNYWMKLVFTLAITTPSPKVLTSLNLCRKCLVSVTIWHNKPILSR